MNVATALVVDDEPQIVRAIRTSLQARGCHVLSAPNGETALELLATEPVDIVVLDLGLPGIDGHEVIARLRAWSDVPVIVVSVREDQSDKVAALEAGADDYITKPFEIPELVARINAVARRGQARDATPVVRFGELEIDLGRRLVTLAGEEVHLTAKEYRLLEVMATNPGKLLSHEWLLREIWGPSYGGEAHYLRVFVRRLRQKLGDDATMPRWIGTEPGVGYRWRPEPDRSPPS